MPEDLRLFIQFSLKTLKAKSYLSVMLKIYFEIRNGTIYKL